VADALICPTCSATNTAGQLFCSSCGSPLGHRCAVCGAPNAADARFCGACGSALTDLHSCSSCGAPVSGSATFCPSCGARVSRELAEEERKVVSVLFVDLVGFTSRSDGADPEDVQARLRPYFLRVKQEIETVGGTVEKFIGDAAVGLFGVPTTHGDDAARAVQAALQITRAMDELNEEHPALGLAIRVAVDTGEAVVAVGARAREGEAIATGDVMNTASRLQQVAPIGGVVVGEVTYRATRELFDYEPLDPVAVKGKSQPIPIWLAKATSERERPPLAPLTGRARELELLTTLWDKVVADRKPQLVTLIGPPGIGKSRLLRELQSRLEAGGLFLKGRCRPYGETTGYGALGHQVFQLAGVYESDPSAIARAKLDEAVASLLPPEEAGEVATHLAILLGLSDEGAPDKQLLFYSVRRFVEGLGGRGPTVLAFEDIHWAEPALLELLDSLATRLRDVPVYLITLARPELLDSRPAWGGGLTRYTAIPLEPLPDAEARSLAENLLAATDAADEVADRLVLTSGGNPLFLEELAASLVERAAGLATGLPTTVQAIITSRLDALPPDERRVLQDASAIGRIFWRGPLAAIAGDDTGLDAALDFLEARDLIRRQPASSVPDDREFIFKHVLTREVVYGTLPRAARRKRHGAIAAYIERASGDRLRQSASILAHHFREAGDDHKTGTYLLMAAEVASRAWAKQQAITLYSEAIEMLDRVGERDALVTARLGRASTLIDAARYTDAVADDLDWLLVEAEGRNLGLAHLARARAAYWMADAKHVSENSSSAAEIAARLGDAELEGRALAARSEAEAMNGELHTAFATWEQAFTKWPAKRRDASFARFYATRAIMSYWSGAYEEALRMATEAHEMGVEASNLEAAVTGACNVGLAMVGLSRHEEGIVWFDRAIELGGEWEEHSYRFTSRAQNMRSGALRELGDLRAAREQSEQALELARDSGFPPAAVSARLDLLFSDLMDGEIGRAEREIPDLLEALEGTKGFHQWLWSIRLSTARAEAALLAGRAEDAAGIAGEALELAERIGRRKYMCRARTDLGWALLELDRGEEAASTLQQAASEAEQLGHLPSLWPALGLLARTQIRLGDAQAALDTTAAARSAVDAFGARLSDGHRKTLFARPEVLAITSAP
jgi:class 3 adenylate cyclase/tetratricopeptide (TPR) repeat protein